MVRHLSVTIDVPLSEAYAFACQPAHFAQWAAGLAETLHHDDRGWVAQTPEGEAIITFTAPNAFGILDHRVTLPGKPEIYIPLRMIAHGRQTEVLFTLFRLPEMDDAAFDRDAGWVRADLDRLKHLLETPR